MASLDRLETLLSADAERAELAVQLRLTISRIARTLRQQVDSGLTPSQRSVLATVARHGPLTPTDLARYERISRPTATRLIAKLRAKGLVNCVPNAADGRSYSIEVSRSGVRLRERGKARKSEYVTSKLRTIDDDEAELLRRALDLLERLLVEQA